MSPAYVKPQNRVGYKVLCLKSNEEKIKSIESEKQSKDEQEENSTVNINEHFFPPMEDAHSRVGQLIVIGQLAMPCVLTAALGDMPISFPPSLVFYFSLNCAPLVVFLPTLRPTLVYVHIVFGYCICFAFCDRLKEFFTFLG